MDFCIYMADVSMLQNPKIQEKYLKQVPDYRQKKVLEQKFPKGKSLSLGAGLLLKKACEDNGIKSADRKVVLGENGKPYFEKYPNAFFSLSHSETKVMCALAPFEVGCDVEQIDKGRLELAERFFHEKETAWLKSISDEILQRESFYRLWTLKESYMKATGLGFALSLGDFAINITETSVSLEHAGAQGDFSFYELSSDDGYKYACCLKNPPPEIQPKIIFVHF